MARAHHYSAWQGDAGNLYTLTDEDIQKLHEVLLGIYKDLKEVCEKEHIRLIAAGGTAIGTVRHKGFIPWDDDMDLFMFRKDFKKFEKIFDQYLSDRYELLSPGTERGANCFLPRIMKKGTTLLGMIDETAPYPHGIYIDINILEYAPDNRVDFMIKTLGADARRFISYSVYWQQYKSQSLRKYLLGSEGKNYYRLRMLIGKIFSFRSAEDWFASFDRYVQGNKSNTLTAPSGAKKYAGESLPLSVVLPLQKVPFEDTEIYIFHDYDSYLRKIYGDYMQVPPPEKRERHMCLKIDFENED